MSQLLQIKERIRTITNLRKVTRAMELVTRTRINRSRLNAVSARVYHSMFADLYALASSGTVTPTVRAGASPAGRSAKTCVVAFLSQKGFCGGFNDRVLSRLVALLRELAVTTTETALDQTPAPEPELYLVGRRNSKWNYALRREFTHIDAPERSFREGLAPLQRTLSAAVLEAMRPSGEPVEIYFVFNELVSILEQKPMVLQVYPPEIVAGTPAVPATAPAAALAAEPLFEPDPEQLLPSLVPAYLEACLYRAYWETIAGENAARLLSMKNANDNASKMLDTLRVEYNKTRQMKITQELSEIVSAFDVLKSHQGHSGEE
ncbi:MAG TPA: FoF1 ATP synthase subunit gamma [Spirochaetia bacterium]|nr:FoF1 ATP synthase subunit gamma [Spirochaetia bacterium]